MHHIYRSLLILLLLVAARAQAQQLWSRSYSPSSSFEDFDDITALRDGTFLLAGREKVYVGGLEKFPRFYLVRINAQGDTLWTRRQAIRSFTNLRLSNLAVDDNAGHLLLAGTSYSTSVQTFLTLLSTATGDTLWTRPLNASSIWLGADQNFVVAGNVQGHPQLTRLSAAGQVLQQTQADYSATEPGSLVASTTVPGGCWLILGSSSGAQKAVYFSEAGVRGQEYSGAFGTPTSFLAVDNGNFLVLRGTNVEKYSPSFSQLWSRQIVSPTPHSFRSSQAQRNTNGEYVVLGSADLTGHSMAGYLIRYDAQGNFLGNTQVFSDNAGIIMSMRFVVAPSTGTYYVGYGTSNLRLVAWAGAAVTVSKPAAAWAGRLYPNPVSASETLHLNPAAPLAGALVLTDMQGRTIRQWHAQPGATRYHLSLHGLAAGSYQLHLTDTQGHRAMQKVLVD
jgi:hypothetical protein